METVMNDERGTLFRVVRRRGMDGAVIGRDAGKSDQPFRPYFPVSAGPIAIMAPLSP